MKTPPGLVRMSGKATPKAKGTSPTSEPPKSATKSKSPPKAGAKARPGASEAKPIVKLTFARGTRIPDPSRLFNSSLEGNTRRAIDIQDPYAAVEVTPEVYAVSYLAGSGFTLTVVLNLATGLLIGFASSNEAWFPVRGTFERVT